MRAAQTRDERCSQKSPVGVESVRDASCIRFASELARERRARSRVVFAVTFTMTMIEKIVLTRVELMDESVFTLLIQ